jgi:hypothetical protein
MWISSFSIKIFLEKLSFLQGTFGSLVKNDKVRAHTGGMGIGKKPKKHDSI